MYVYEDCLTPPQRKELASIVEHFPNLTRTEQIAMVKTRQCVDGVPSIAFEMKRTNSDSILRDPASNAAVTAFAGQFDLITDKTNMKVLALNTSQYDPNQSFKFIIYNIPSFIVYNEMLSEINFDGEDLEDGLCALCIYNISDLILLYNLISRELNNFIDDGKLKTKASSLINLIEREDNRNGTR